MSAVNHHITDEEIIGAIEDVNEPFATASEISDAVGMTRQGVHRRLQELHEDGRVGRKKVGSRAVGWWVERA